MVESEGKFRTTRQLPGRLALRENSCGRDDMQGKSGAGRDESCSVFTFFGVSAVCHYAHIHHIPCRRENLAQLLVRGAAAYVPDKYLPFGVAGHDLIDLYGWKATLVD